MHIFTLDSVSSVFFSAGVYVLPLASEGGVSCTTDASPCWYFDHFCRNTSSSMSSTAMAKSIRPFPLCAGGVPPLVTPRGHKKPSGQGWARDPESVRAAALPMATLAVAKARSRGRCVVAHAPILCRMTHPNALSARRRFRCALAEVAAGRAQTSRGGSVAPDNARSSGHRRWSRLIISCHRLVRVQCCRCAGRHCGRRA